MDASRTSPPAIEAAAVMTGALLSGTQSKTQGYSHLPEPHNLLGMLVGLSTMTMPVLVQTTTTSPHLLTQWKHIFDRGHIQGPSLAITTSLMNCYAAWLRAAAHQPWISFAIAAALTIGIVPYTVVFMGKINTTLFAAVDQCREGKRSVSKAEADRLVSKWTALHAVRSMLPLLGAVVGALALLRVLEL